MKVFSVGRQGHPEDVHVWGRPLTLALLVAYEGGTGLLNAIFGFCVLLVVNGYWNVAPLAALNRLVMRELAEDPQDMLFGWIAGHFPRISHDASLHLAWIVIIFGLIKISIAGGLWYRAQATRKAAVAVFSAFAVYGFVSLSASFGFWKLVAVLIDVFFIYYFLVQLPRHLAADNPSRNPAAERKNP